MTLVERTEEQEAVGDDGYRRIRTDIVFGRLRPGQKLRLEGLKEDYGVSVSTLREILNRLAAEGFVLAEGSRGFEVAPISAENLQGSCGASAAAGGACDGACRSPMPMSSGKGASSPRITSWRQPSG